MSNICNYAKKVDEDLYLCSKYKSYCYLEQPDEIRCKDMYGSEYNDKIILDDEDSIEDIM